MVAERERGLRAETLALAPPAALPGREHAAAYLISGVPGAGKSTVARLLALHFDRAAHVDIAQAMGRDLAEADWWRLLDALLLVAVHPAGRAP